MRVNREQFIKALKTVSPCVPKVHFFMSDLLTGKVICKQGYVYAFDGCGMLCCPVEGLEFNGAIEIKPLLRVLSKTKTDEIEFNVKKERVRISAGKINMSLPYVSTEKTPFFDMDVPSWEELPSNFIEGIGLASISTAANDKRFFCGHILVENNRIASVDGFRLTIFELSNSINARLFIPCNYSKIFKEFSMQWFASHVNMWAFKSDSGVLFMLQKVGESEDFPDVEPILSEFENGVMAELPENFIDVIQRASVFAFDHVIKVVSSNGEVTVYSSNTISNDFGEGEFEEKIDFDTGTDFEFFINYSFLLNILEHSRECRIIDRGIEFFSDNWRHIIMFMKME